MCFFYLLRIKENNFYSISAAKVQTARKNSPNIHIPSFFYAKKLLPRFIKGTSNNSAN
jgi:hypothetical protein